MSSDGDAERYRSMVLKVYGIRSPGNSADRHSVVSGFADGCAD
jgi:hypothetical protein